MTSVFCILYSDFCILYSDFCILYSDFCILTSEKCLSAQSVSKKKGWFSLVPVASRPSRKLRVPTSDRKMQKRAYGLQFLKTPFRKNTYLCGKYFTMTLSVFSDENYMKQALDEARQALDEGEVPIGAVMVVNNKVIAKTRNLTETLNDVTAHAEMQAITAASNALGSKYLDECTLYVTLEPCPMCAAALRHAHVGRVVWAADDDKNGFHRYGDMLHPKTDTLSGVLHDECQSLLKDFFKGKRG